MLVNNFIQSYMSLIDEEGGKDHPLIFQDINLHIPSMGGFQSYHPKSPAVYILFLSVCILPFQPMWYEPPSDQHFVFLRR